MSQDLNIPEMTQKLEAVGLKNVETKYKWDDGSDHDGVSKIYVRGGPEGIQFIKFYYVKDGQPKDESFHGYSDQGFTHMFEINHLKGEYLVSIEGYSSSDVIQSLQFKTNLKISEFMGYEYHDNKFILGVDGKKIIGFHGSARSNLSSLGAYVNWITPTRMEANGAKGGREWDDGANYEAVTKIHVHAGYKGMQNIKFDYVDKDGHLKEGPIHGSSQRGGFPLEPFEINHVDKEYLLSIDGYYNETDDVIQALQFRTNMKTSELMGYTENGTKFSVGCNGHKIIGFHGYAEKKLNSLGAYFTTLPLTKLEYKDSVKGHLYDNGYGGYTWDDGTFQGVRKVYVYYDGYNVRCVRFEYDDNGKMESRDHGSKVEVSVDEGEFVLDYPNEYITSVEGTITSLSSGETRISSLTFKTSKRRTSPAFGNVFGSGILKFMLERKGCAIVGFHGRSTCLALHGLGAYFFPTPPPQDGEKLEAQAGDGV